MELSITKRDDAWFDNGILCLTEMIRNIKLYDDCVNYEILPDRLKIDVKDKEKLAELFTREIQNQLNSHIFIKVEDKNGVEKNVIRDHILLQYGKSIDGKNTVGERLFSNKESRSIVEAFLNEETNSKKKQVCILCGEEYDASVSSKLSVDILKQAVHPLATKNSAISHIRTEITDDGYEKNSAASNYSNVCVKCYMLGVMQYANKGIIYNTDMSQEKSYMFMPYITNLKEAFEFREKYTNGVLSSSKRYSNLRFSQGKEIDFRGKYSLFLLFLERISDIEDVDNGLEGTELLDLFTLKEDIRRFKNWYQIEANTGKLKNPAVNAVRLMDNVYELIFIHELRPYIDVIKNTWFIGDYDLSYGRKEEMAQAFVNNDFHKFVMAFRPLKKDSIRLKGEAYQKLDDLIYYWRWKPMALNQESQKTIKAVGRIIAATSQYRKSLVYGLEKVRTIQDLLNVISETSKGYYAVSDKLDENIKKYLNPLSLSDLTSMLNDEKLEKRQFDVIKDTLAINSFVSLIKNDEEDK